MNETTLTPRQSFRETVALVAAKAKAKLPQAVNGRIEHAVKLVLGHDVEPQADGSILVGSSSDPMKVYRLEGTTCTCQDFQYGRAPSGWCAHRIAAGIAKRVGELLPHSTPVETEPEVLPEPWPDNDPEPDLLELAETPEAAPVAVPVAPLPEAPASVNVRVVIGGREVQWTLRDTDEGRLAIRLEELLQRYPLPQPQPPAQPTSPPAQQLSPQQFNALAQHRPIEGACPIHQVQMHWNEGKDGRKGWFSHRTADGQWCKGR